ncbi:hypothetical protein BK011_07825 [Tenericutes bacterium MZ-XQ]|nr:hypothetical protein BK011_07825 [Tenericutes bacterium MZ-XQ]
MIKKQLMLILNFSRTSIIIPITTLYYLRIGLDLSDISFLILVGSIVVFLLEFPTGLLSDKYSSKKLVIMGLFFEIFGVVLIVLNVSYFFIVIGNIMIAISIAILSGAIDVYILANFKSKNETLKDFYARLNLDRILVNLLVGVLGLFLFYYNFYLPMIIKIFLSVTVYLIVFLTDDENSRQSQSMSNSIKSLMKKCYQDVKSNRILFSLIILSFVFIFSVNTIFTFWQPILSDYLSLENIKYGIIISFVLNSLGLVVGAFFYKNKLKKMNQNRLFIITYSIFILILSFVVIADDFIFVLLLILLYYVLMSIIGPSRHFLINSRVDNTNRASILSFYSLIDQLGVFFFGLVGTIVLSIYDLDVLLLLASVLPLLAVLPNLGKFLRVNREN